MALCFGACIHPLPLKGFFRGWMEVFVYVCVQVAVVRFGALCFGACGWQNSANLQVASQHSSPLFLKKGANFDHGYFWPQKISETPILSAELVGLTI